jgi:CheY-like chemotaxis protein
LLATDANEAYTICQKNLPQFVVLNFYQKNAPDGFSFARRLRNEYPHIHFFFITGARKQDLEKSPDYMPTIQTLHKPFTRKQLLAIFAHSIA